MGAARAGCYTGHCLMRLRDREIIHIGSNQPVPQCISAVPADADLQAYVASGESLRVAGGFTLDGLGGWFVDGIEGDPSNVIGVEPAAAARLLSDVGVSVNALWADH